MIEYIGLVSAIFLIYILVEIFVKNKKRVLFVVLAYASIMLFIFLEKVVGPDYYSYLSIFDKINSTPWKELLGVDLSVEIGFKVAVKFFTLISSNGAVFIRLFTCLNVALYAISCSRYSKNPLLFTIAFLVLLFSWMPILRQAFAAGLVLIGFKYIKDREPIKYCLIVAVAMTFHMTAIIAIIIYPIYNINTIKRSNCFRAVIICISTIIIVFNKIIIIYLRKIVKILLGRYFIYISNKDFGLNMLIILLGILFLLYMFLDRRNKKDIRAINFMYLLVFWQCFSAITPMAGRFMLYFYPLIGFAIERLLPITNNKCKLLVVRRNIYKNNIYRKILLSCLFLFAMFFWWYTYIRLNYYVCLF